MKLQNADIQKMQEIILLIQQADEAYYVNDIEIMSNAEYDALCQQLKTLENKTGVILNMSPSVNMPQAIATSLQKARHATKMLSLNKTKDTQQLVYWLGNRKGCLSWKLDGLTVVLTYHNGTLMQAVTRGNGEIGEIVTENAKNFLGVPYHIPYNGRIVIRGEAMISYTTFQTINKNIPETDAKYKNPRNLASGSVRQLDPAVTKARGIEFIAFELIEADNIPSDSYAERLDALAVMGFTPVEHVVVDAGTLCTQIKAFSDKIENNPLPSDGLVLTIDSVSEAIAMGTTAKYPLGTMAFKWQDEMAETTLRGIEWSPSRTGLINPVALFDPVELEGTTVSRASLHNISIIKHLKLGLNDTIRVYKSNMIIPQVYENLTNSDNWETTMLPKTCPSCGKHTALLETDNGKEPGTVITLHCPNPECPAKHIKRFALMTSRDALDIHGLSESTLEKLINMGLIRQYQDLFLLKNHEDIISQAEGFGETSTQNLITAIETARNTTFKKLLYGLGIPGIGRSQSENITAVFPTPESLFEASLQKLSSIEGIGEIKAMSILTWANNQANRQELDNLMIELKLQQSQEQTNSQKLLGKTYVITGSLHSFPNREALKNLITSHGGKVANSVSEKTYALINNDNMSNSTKNKKAKELGVPIITEDEFLQSIT